MQATTAEATRRVNADLAHIAAGRIPPSWEMGSAAPDDELLRLFDRINRRIATFADVETCFEAHFFNAATDEEVGTRDYRAARERWIGELYGRLSS